MNVRWDAVTESGLFEVLRPIQQHPFGRTRCTTNRTKRRVYIWLFGRLAAYRERDPVVLELASPCRLRDVLDALGKQFGPDLLREIVGRDGEPLETCCVSVNGVLVRNGALPIPDDHEGATVELILFREIEGG